MPEAGNGTAPAATTTMLISATKAAEYLGCSYSLLYQLRKAGTGPSYVKLRSYIKYDKDELDRWVRERTIITK